MEFEKIIAPSPKELFIGQMVHLILAGRLKSGDKLPTERELAEKMGVNRSLVHNGLEELERMGFISIEPRRGIFVSNYSKDGNFNTLMAIAKYTGGEFDEKTRIALVETRNAIVGGAMIRLCKIDCAKQLGELRAMVERHREIVSEDSSKAPQCMLDFNLELTNLCGNAFFSLILNSFAVNNIAFWQRCVGHWGIETVFKQEDKMLDLIEAGKGHEAALYIENIFEAYMADNGIER